MKILIAGASGGVGRYLSNHFDNRDHILYLTSHHHPIIYPPFDAEVHKFECDFTNSDSVAFVYKHIFSLDVIINCMGHVENTSVYNMKEWNWDRVIESNLKTVFLSCKYGLSKLVKGGHIINITSVLGEMGIAGASNYCAAKGAVESFTKSFAQECIKRKIFVNALSLGYFKVGLGLNLSKDIADQMKEKIPLKEFGEPEEIGLAIDYLIASKYLSGSILKVNGGLCN